MNQIYTIGHSNHTISKLIELLNLQQIEMVVDVRSFPSSKYNPQFNKPLLKADLNKAGIAYLFLGQKLGGKGGFKEILAKPEFEQGIMELVALLSKGKKIALLCAEENPHNCHRCHLLTPALEAKGLKVHHIRGNGKIESVRQMKLFPNQA